MMLSTFDDRARIEQACETLYHQHQASLIQHARLRGCDDHEAWDVVQDVFLRLFRLDLLISIESYPVEIQTGLLNRTLRWVIMNHWRYKSALRRGNGSEMASLEVIMEEGHDVATSITPASEHDRSWAMSVVDRGLQRLRSSVSAAKWSSLELSLFGGTAAEVDVCLTPALRVALHRARVRLREMVSLEAGSGRDIPAGRAALFHAVCGQP